MHFNILYRAKVMAKSFITLSKEDYLRFQNQRLKIVIAIVKENPKLEF